MKKKIIIICSIILVVVIIAVAVYLNNIQFFNPAFKSSNSKIGFSPISIIGLGFK